MSPPQSLISTGTEIAHYAAGPQCHLQNQEVVPNVSIVNVKKTPTVLIPSWDITKQGGCWEGR